MDEKINTVATLLKDREIIIKNIENLNKTKYWTRINVSGEDAAERHYDFSLGGTSENNKENLELIKSIHYLMSENLSKRLDTINEKINILLK